MESNVRGDFSYILGKTIQTVTYDFENGLHLTFTDGTSMTVRESHPLWIEIVQTRTAVTVKDDP